MRWVWGLGLILLGLLACVPAESGPQTEGPRLIGEATLPPPSITPLVLQSPSPLPLEPESPGRPVAGTLRPDDPQAGGFRLITATPPDSPTPYPTSTPSRTPAPSLTRSPIPSRTLTPSPTLSPTASATGQVQLLPSLSPAPSPTNHSLSPCPFAWFIVPPPSPNCPLTAVVVSPAAYQAMQGGGMIWVQNGLTIFILFSDGGAPAWLFAPDTYSEGEALNIPLPPAGLFAPERGFGKLWAGDGALQSRLGWGVGGEVPYTALIQADAATGTRYLTGPGAEIYALGMDQSAWERTR